MGLQKFPKYAEAYLGRAQIYVQTQQWEMALQDYQRLVIISPKCGLGFIGIGDCYFGLKKDQEAIQAYSKAIEVDKTVADTACYKRGKLSYRLKNYKDSLPDWELVHF